MRPNDVQTDLELAAVKTIATASKTPFKTAFLATMGIAAAQIVVTFLFFGGLGVIGTLIYFVTKR